MFRIQDINVPIDVMNIICEKTTVHDQARVAQVCHGLNIIANRTHTTLFKYKAETVAFRHGDNCLYIKKHPTLNCYDVYVKRKGKRESGMYVMEETRNVLVAAIPQGVAEVIKVLLTKNKKGEMVAREFSPSDYVAHAPNAIMLI